MDVNKQSPISCEHIMEVTLFNSPVALTDTGSLHSGSSSSTAKICPHFACFGKVEPGIEQVQLVFLCCVALDTFSELSRLLIFYSCSISAVILTIPTLGH